jgi:serine/threonine protein kinase, bacterial
MPVEVGEEFAEFTILRVLGAGAMGTVYLASHPRLPRQDAVKVLSAELTADKEYRARFLREADLAASLSHPHILGIYDRGEYDGHLWISMAYVAGTDAARLLERYPGGMPVGEALPIITAVASALDYAHQRGLLHRDVKPANILLDSQAPRIFLADFGIARRIDDASRLTATNMTVGTVAYAAPEQLRGEVIDGRADQYALACTAYHLLAGVPPYDHSNPAVVIAQHVSASPPSIGARHPELAVLDRVFATALAKNPFGRFASCQDFAHQLDWHLRVGTSTASPTRYTRPALRAPALPPPSASPPIRTRSGWRRPPVLILALVAVALLIAGGVFAGLKLTRHHNPPATAAAPPATAAAPPTTAAAGGVHFNGTYRADYRPGTDLEGKPVAGAPTTTATWGVRSTCGPGGCVATASITGGSGIMLVSNLVFDQVGGSWVAVGLASAQCNNAPAEVWVVYTLQPHPDGTLSGETTRATTNSGCVAKRTVNFTRTGDPDVDRVPDPATLPPRAVSAAEALRGRYHEAMTYTNGTMVPGQDDLTVRTYCLRTVDRCMSLFHAPDGVVTLVFGGGKWTRNEDGTVPCQGGGTAHIKITAEYPLPEQLQDPIPMLTGNGSQNVSPGSACASAGHFNDKFVRTGD